jgi:hypothetical protein
MSLEEEVSGDLVTSSNDEDDVNNEEDDADDDDNLESVFFCDARDIQNRMSRVVGTASMEDRRFRELFWSPMEIVLHVWYMMEEDGLLPDKSKPKHLLWTLYFLKVYISTRGPRMLRSRRRGRCRRPQNTAKMGVALHRVHPRDDGRCGELFFVVSRRDCLLLTPRFACRRRPTDCL